MAEGKKKNYGKDFEADFKKCIPDTVFFQRIKDDTLKFKAVVNICDFILYRHPFIYLLELKTHKGSSLPFSAISEGQIDGLLKASSIRGVKAGLVINFRELEETYYLDIRTAVEYISKDERKSFPIEFCRLRGIKLKQEKIRVKFRYGVDEFLDKL